MFQAAKPLEADFVLFFAGMLLALIGLVLGLVFIVGRLACGGEDSFWRAQGSSPVRKAVILIAVIVGAQLAIGAILDRMGFLDPIVSKALSLLSWTLIPAAFLQFGLITWPERVGSASPLRLLLVGGIGFCLAAVCVYGGLVLAGGEIARPGAGPLVTMLMVLIVAACLEEVVFRALLLTGLVDLTGSRFQAVFLSAVLFAAGHAPLALYIPLVQGGLPEFVLAAQAYSIMFLFQAMAGMALGVLWLRTGSITVVTLVHALLNVPAMLQHGL